MDLFRNVFAHTPSSFIAPFPAGSDFAVQGSALFFNDIFLISLSRSSHPTAFFHLFHSFNCFAVA